MSMPQSGGVGVGGGAAYHHHQQQQQTYQRQNFQPQYQQQQQQQQQQPPSNFQPHQQQHPQYQQQLRPGTTGATIGGGGAGGGGFEMENISRMMRSKLAVLRKYKKKVNPYLPITCRLLLVSTFIEDGVRILFEMRHQIDFLKHEYYIPRFIARLMLLANIIISFIAVVFILGRKKLSRGKYEIQASYALIACVIYQQILYGRHSPIGSGNLGFFVRNLCLSGSLLLITCQSRLASGQSALPMGLLDSNTDQQLTISYLQLASRIMLVLLGLEFMATLGIFGTILAIPVILAVLVGYKSEISGAILLILYFLHNVLNSAFWSVSGSYVSQIMQYEFFQTLSIMGGLLMLIMTGPGAISVDEMRGRKAF